MMNKKIKKLIICGLVTISILFAAVLQSIFFNHGRLVYLTDFSTYQFEISDLPMWFSGAIFISYIIYFIKIFLIMTRQHKKSVSNYTRTFSPWLSILGFSGFLGFLGFYTYFQSKQIYPFFFFIFFGFFGFYYEGKMSHTLKDELYWFNKHKADSIAYHCGFKLVFLLIWLIAMGMFSYKIEWCAILMFAGISLIYAFVLFYSSYLLYHYETEEE